MNLRILERRLSKLGAITVTAVDGVDALDKYREKLEKLTGSAELTLNSDTEGIDESNTDGVSLTKRDGRRFPFDAILSKY